MNPISAKHRGVHIVYEVRNPEEGHFYAEGTAQTKLVGTLHVFSGKCASYQEANDKLLAYAQKLIDEAYS